MPITLTGTPATYTLAQLNAPSLVLPVNGDDVDAAVVDAAAQKIVDYVASAGGEVFDIRTAGVNRIVGVTSIADLKAIVGMTGGQLVAYRDPSYIGSGTQGLLSGFGLFMFVEAVTWPQTLVDGVPNAYLVVTPNAGVGRWVNASAGVGWNVGTSPSFQPRPAARTRQWHNEAEAAGSYPAYSGAGPGYVGTDVTLATGLPAGAAIALDFDLSLTSTSLSTTVKARIEVSSPSISGGAWTRVDGTSKALGGAGATNDIWASLHLGGFFTAPASDTYDFRAALLVDTGQTATVLRSWSARGLSYNAS